MGLPKDMGEASAKGQKKRRVSSTEDGLQAYSAEDNRGRQLASHPLVVMELDMAVVHHWLCGADFVSVKA